MVTSRDSALAEESAWLQIVDLQLGLGYEPVVAIFRDAQGELETLSRMRHGLVDFLDQLAESERLEVPIEPQH